MIQRSWKPKRIWIKMKKRQINLITLVVLLLLGGAAPGSGQDEVDYQMTVTQLTEKLANGPLGAMEYYNLGTAYSKLDSLGWARLYLEKAQLLAPWNRKIEQNIKWVKTELATDVAILPEYIQTRIWKKMAMTAPPIYWQVLGLLAFIVGLVALFFVLYRLKQKPTLRHYMLIGGILLLGLIFIGFSSSASGHLYGGKRCVVTDVNGGLRQAPEKSAAEVALLLKGGVVQLLKSTGDWWQVRLEDGAIGWIEKIYVKNISFDPTK